MAENGLSPEQKQQIQEQMQNIVNKGRADLALWDKTGTLSRKSIACHCRKTNQPPLCDGSHSLRTPNT